MKSCRADVKMKLILIGLLLLPFILARLDNGFLFTDEANKEICTNKNPEFIGPLVEDFQCMENKIKLVIPDKLTALKDCWKNSLGIEYPSKDEDWVNIYCQSNKAPYILTNIANHCFLRKYIKQEEIKIELEMKKLPQYEDQDETMRDQESKLTSIVDSKIKFLASCMEGTEVHNGKEDQSLLRDSWFTQQWVTTPAVDQWGDEIPPVEKEYCDRKESLSKFIKDMRCISTSLRS